MDAADAEIPLRLAPAKALIASAPCFSLQVLLQGLAGLREVQAIIKDFIFQHEGDVPLIQLRV